MAKQWKCARCRTQNVETTLTCANCRMIRGAVVVQSAQVPTERATPAPSSSATHWVMPADKPSAKRRGVFILLVAVLIVGAGAAVLNASPYAPIVDGPSTGVMSAADLQVGECFDLEATTAGTITSVTPRSCHGEHQYELFLAETLTAVGYPTDTEFDVWFKEDCVPAFSEYVGAPYDSSVLDIYWIVPSRQGWREGDRAMQCAVYNPDLPRLTAPLKDSGPDNTRTRPII